MTLIESHMLAKESQTNRVDESDSFSSIMTLLWDRLTPLIFSVQFIVLLQTCFILPFSINKIPFQTNRVSPRDNVQGDRTIPVQSEDKFSVRFMNAAFLK